MAPSTCWNGNGERDKSYRSPLGHLPSAAAFSGQYGFVVPDFAGMNGRCHSGFEAGPQIHTCKIPHAEQVYVYAFFWVDRQAVSDGRCLGNSSSADGGLRRHQPLVTFIFELIALPLASSVREKSGPPASHNA